MHDLAAQAKADDALDDAVFLDVQMDEVNEWEVLAEEGNADDQNTVEDDPPTFETIRILFQMTTDKVLGEIAKKLDVTSNGPKRKLFDRIRDSDHVEKVDNDSFDYHCQIVKGEKVPTWIILNPEPVAAVPGVDMATDVQFGFYGPTIKENAVGGERHNFATIEADRIQRPKFEAKKKERADRKNNTAPANNHGGPSPAARKRIPTLKVACPKDFFNLQITPEFVQWMTNVTNCRATSDGAGAGTGEFKDWVPFDDAEIYRFIDVLIANGLAPKSRIDY